MIWSLRLRFLRVSVGLFSLCCHYSTVEYRPQKNGVELPRISVVVGLKYLCGFWFLYDFVCASHFFAVTVSVVEGGDVA